MKSNKIKNMEIGGRILGEVMDYLVKYVKPGISELDIEREATRLILEKGGKSAFKLVPDYNYTTCIATNEVVVHGIPSNRVLKEGDIVGIDCGVFYGGYNTDMGETIKISNLKSQISNEKDKEVNRFLETGKKALFRAISMAQAGNRVGDISKAIQKTVEGVGYSVVRSLVGHGVGKQLHESPEIPGYLER